MRERMRERVARDRERTHERHEHGRRREAAFDRTLADHHRANRRNDDRGHERPVPHETIEGWTILQPRRAANDADAQARQRRSEAHTKEDDRDEPIHEHVLRDCGKEHDERRGTGRDAAAHRGEHGRAEL